MDTSIYPLRGTLRTFSGIASGSADERSGDYIITRQTRWRLVLIVTIHLQLLKATDLDHNIVCATVQLPRRFARDTGDPPLGANPSLGGKKRLIPAYVSKPYDLWSELHGGKPGDGVRESGTSFANKC